MDHPTTTPSVHCVTLKAMPGRKYNFKCPCTISFCQNDGNKIRAFLETAGCCELLAPKTVAYVPNPSSHQHRKQYAFRKSVEHHLKIPREVREQNKKYQVFSYHWPTPLLKLKLRNASLLNDVQVKLITEEQQSLYGITSNALREFVNTYKHNILPFIVSLQLLALEQVDLKCYVQAPVATRDEIMAYATSFVSQRLARSTSREFNRLSQVDDEYATSFVSQRSACSTGREFNKLSQVDDELSQVDDELSPVDDELSPVDDEPSPPDDRASPLLAPTQQQLLSGLIGKFERYQASQRSVDEFPADRKIIVVIGCSADERLFALLRGSNKIAKRGYPTSQSVTFRNPLFPEGPVAMFQCSTHNLKASQNQLFCSQQGGSRKLAVKDIHFGWYEIEEAYQRDSKKLTGDNKLRKASVELDSFLLMCVPYAKAPSAHETLLELCHYLGGALGCLNELKQLQHSTALEIFRYVVPFFKNKGYQRNSLWNQGVVADSALVFNS